MIDMPVKITPPTEQDKKMSLHPTVFHIGLTVILLVASVLISVLFRNSGMPLQNIILIFSLFVLVISAATPGYLLGFIAAIASTFMFDFFFEDPIFKFSFTSKFPITLIIMLIVTVTSSAIAAYMKDLAYTAQKKQKETQMLYNLSEELLDASDSHETIMIANRYLVNNLHRSVVFYTSSPHLEDSGFFSQFPGDVTIEVFDTKQERRTATYAFEENLNAGHNTNYNGERKIFYTPLSSQQKVIGVVGVSCYNYPLDEDSVVFLKLITSQFALALERQLVREHQKQAKLEAEREKMRSGLLRAISHDLRTPLTSILGSATTLLEEGNNLDYRTRKKLTEGMKEETQWLIRMVENLLSVTRIADEHMKMEKQPEAAEEVVAGAVEIVRKWYPDYSIHVKVPDQLVVVPMDATLISQVLINLLENSVKNSTPEELIMINLKTDGDNAIFEVSDNGTGISEELLENLFDSPSQPHIRSSDSGSGSGIGLSICSTIVKAHGGTIKGENKKTGGAIFSFTLPINEGEK